jgi:hypothetical protein
MVNLETKAIDYGDERLSERFWNKVHVIPETPHWEWTAARKKHGNNPTYTFIDRKVTTVLQVYFRTFYPEVDTEKYKPRMSCGKNDCVNPNHIEVVEKGTCLSGHMAPKEKGGGCSECKHIWYINNRKGSGGRRPSQNEKVGVTSIRRRTPTPTNGLSVFGDIKPDKPWRPAGWSEQPKVNQQWSASHQNNEQEHVLEHSG